MKKLFSALLVFCMLLTLAACGETAPGKETSGDTTASPRTTAAASEDHRETVMEEETTEAPTQTVPGQTVTEPAPVETAPSPTNEPWEEEEEEAVPPETLPAGAHITLSGAPTLGTANGNSYTNASIGLTMQIPDSYSFVSEPSMMEMNEVAHIAEVTGKDLIYITSDFLDIVWVWALKLGSANAGGNTSVEDAFFYDVEKAVLKLEETGAEAESEPCFVSFTAGDVVASRVTATAGTEVTTYLFLGYQVGDYLVVVMVNDFYGDAVEDLLSGIDIA